mgnify:CR=1 FL=1
MKVFFKTVSVLSLFMMICMSSSAFAADVAKIGVVDFQKILENSTAGKAAQAVINKEGDKMEEELKNRGQQIETSREKLQREALVMSAEKREEQEREIRIKINDLKTLQKRYMQEFKEREKELVNEIQKEVVELVENLGQKEGFLLILERRESGAVYFPNALDITDKVIEAYNQEYAKKQ